MLEVSQLTITKGEYTLFDALSFAISPGELVQIEGRNGTGKTTLLRLLIGLGQYDKGLIQWKGATIRSNREEFHQDLLYIGHQTGIKPELTAFENLAFFCSMQRTTKLGNQEIYDALLKVGLVGKEDIPVAKLSAGQQRRAALARLWLSEQILWILDEPLTAIDKQGMQILESLFIQHTSKGGIVVLTTHQDMFKNHPKLRKIRLGDS
ncbi:cytochrome c biogenesis heme-transporting ATPase CcmA [Vibrio caribbeanicus]|uniref:cytochrome c biogenesis heme-transporting ATPase CcmA n=1 Tax=Vibrio caribbeanicus TaxID=701175 RepID=UPI002283C3E2|nr:cytochrome c biogenesis heme-transporting ATPase CcmA [Vibrio caribbeanicus]MCY9845645.1 cytochrome c biogenesis heme-transporting ATPase CcmA [Vibrio caribbeanicus]